jgi:hypothetical protein
MWVVAVHVQNGTDFRLEYWAGAVEVSIVMCYNRLSASLDCQIHTVCKRPKWATLTCSKARPDTTRLPCVCFALCTQGFYSTDTVTLAGLSIKCVPTRALALSSLYTSTSACSMLHSFRGSYWTPLLSPLIRQ